MYCSTDNLVEKYGKQLLIHLTVKDPTGEETEPDYTVISREINRVVGIIDGYLRNRYTLPLDAVPDELAAYAEDLAIARIYGCLPERTAPEDVTRNAKAAMDWLKDVQKGVVILSVATLTPASSGEDGASGFFRTNKKRSDRLFDDERLGPFTRGH